MSDIVTEVIEDAEAYFPPVPGGRVDTARKQAAARHDQAAAVPEAAPRKARPITVKVREPDMFGTKTITLAAGAISQAIPADPNRKRGMLNLITASASVVVARDRAGADTGTGYTLVSANPPLEIGHTREVWLSNPGGSAVQVSVLTESYSQE
jgi:hypothetical protein